MAIRTFARHPRSVSGQSTVELAVSLPLFLLLIAGTAEIANIAWASVQVNNAARAGAAFASESRTNAADTAHIKTAAQNDAPSLTNLQVNSSMNCSCVSSSGDTSDPGCTSTNLTSCPSPSVIQVSVQVTTSAVVKPFAHYPGLPATYTLHAQATMGVVQ